MLNARSTRRIGPGASTACAEVEEGRRRRPDGEGQAMAMAMARHDAMFRHLCTLGDDPVQMTFDEIEQLVGPLPRAATAQWDWWTNDRTRRRPHARAWLDARRHVDHVARSTRLVRFTAGRGGAAPERPGWQSVQLHPHDAPATPSRRAISAAESPAADAARSVTGGFAGVSWTKLPITATSPRRAGYDLQTGDRPHLAEEPPVVAQPFAVRPQ
jgi:hypothetical protein